ncbi:Uncharacterised protein g10744 [Pycnogonum litorale]
MGDDIDSCKRFNFADFSNATEPNRTEFTLKIIGFLPLVLIAIVGNGSLILTLVREKKARSGVRMFIVNLSFSDLLLVLFLPWTYTVQNVYSPSYIMGPVMCKITPAAEGKGQCQ